MKVVGENTLECVELVEHPGGSDGGDFPCYERFTLEQGRWKTPPRTVVYSYGLPDSPTDIFCDEDPQYYNNCSTREKAVLRLKQELEKLLKAKELAEQTLAALECGAQYVTICRNEDDLSEDEDEDLVLEDEDEDDQD